MKKLQRQKGFTLVELAIVLTIIGLLIGGILKGQQLIANAQVTAQIAQFKAIEAAMTTFVDQYQELPGDMKDASTRLPPACGGAVCGNGGGDGVIGTASANPTAITGAATEEMLFWQHLSAANLIAGVAGTGAVIGQGIPPGKFTGSGMIMNNLSGGPYIGGAYVSVIGSLAAPVPAAGQGPMTPNQAAQIDRKMDDGQSQTGSIVGNGVGGECKGGPAASGGYDETKPGKDCIVSYHVQN